MSPHDPLLPPIPQPGDSTEHEAGDAALLQSFMVTAGVSADPDADTPGVPVVVMDFVLLDAVLGDLGPAVPLRIIVEHSTKSSHALLDGLGRAVAMLDNLGKPQT